jgi:hypothetical protein
MQVTKVEPYVLASAHKSLIELSRLINNPTVIVSYRATWSQRTNVRLWIGAGGAITAFVVGFIAFFMFHHAKQHVLPIEKQRRTS